MRHVWSSMAVVGGSLLGVLLLSDVGLTAPKKGSTYLLCKCTCTAEDELGKTHYGPSQGLWFTTSGGQCLGTKCTVGRLEGSTRDCLVTEKSESANVPPGSLQGEFQQTPTTPGGMRGPTTGTILRRGVEGEASTPSPTEPEEKSK